MKTPDFATDNNVGRKSGVMSRREQQMHADSRKLDSSSIDELRKELADVDVEMHDPIQEIPFARYIQLYEYRIEICNEIKRRSFLNENV